MGPDSLLLLRSCEADTTPTHMYSRCCHTASGCKGSLDDANPTDSMCVSSELLSREL